MLLASGLPPLSSGPWPFDDRRLLSQPLPDLHAGQSRPHTRPGTVRSPRSLTLRIWGCHAYAHVRKEDCAVSSTPRPRPCIFVGYSQDASTYRLWNPRLAKIIESRDDVHFVEDQTRLSRQGGPPHLLPLPPRRPYHFCHASNLPHLGHRSPGTTSSRTPRHGSYSPPDGTAAGRTRSLQQVAYRPLAFRLPLRAPTLTATVATAQKDAHCHARRRSLRDRLAIRP